MEDRHEPWGKKKGKCGESIKIAGKVNRIKHSTMRYIDPLNVAMGQPALLIVRNF